MEDVPKPAQNMTLWTIVALSPGVISVWVFGETFGKDLRRVGGVVGVWIAQLPCTPLTWSRGEARVQCR